MGDGISIVFDIVVFLYFVGEIFELSVFSKCIFLFWGEFEGEFCLIVEDFNDLEIFSFDVCFLFCRNLIFWLLGFIGEDVKVGLLLLGVWKFKFIGNLDVLRLLEKDWERVVVFVVMFVV